jgi:serine/threonine protein kinase
MSSLPILDFVKAATGPCSRRESALPTTKLPSSFGSSANNYTAAVDVWSLGAVAVCVRTSKPPFEHMDKFYHRTDSRASMAFKTIEWLQQVRIQICRVSTKLLTFWRSTQKWAVQSSSDTPFRLKPPSRASDVPLGIRPIEHSNDHSPNPNSSNIKGHPGEPHSQTHQNQNLSGSGLTTRNYQAASQRTDSGYGAAQSESSY